ASAAHRELLSFPTRRSSDLASGRRLHAFTLAILSVAGITTGATMAVQAADLSVSPVQLAEADRTAQQGIPVVIPATLKMARVNRSEEHTSELQSRRDLVCRL